MIANILVARPWGGGLWPPPPKSNWHEQINANLKSLPKKQMRQRS